MKAMAILGFLFCLLAGPAGADIDPWGDSQCTLDGPARLLLIPDGDGSDAHPLGDFTVTIHNGMNGNLPINNAIVEVIVQGQPAGRVHLCRASEQHYDRTGPDGVATIHVPGGGCYKGQSAVVIRVNGVEFRRYAAAVSPDYAGIDDIGEAGRWSLSITAADFASFAMAFHGGGASCHDYDNNGVTGASDFAVFGQVWSGGTRSCEP